MEFHMKVLGEQLGKAFEYIDHVVTEQYFGTPTPALAEMLKQWDTPDVVTTWQPTYAGGFIRSTVG